MKQAICLSLWKTRERGSNRATSTSSLSRSLQRNPTEWAWGYRFAGRLSLIMAGVWRWPTVSPMDRSFRYFYRSENALAYEATKSFANAPSPHHRFGRGAVNDLPAAADGDDKAAASAKKMAPETVNSNPLPSSPRGIACCFP